MKNFIEVTYQGNAKYTINVNQIVWFSAPPSGKTTLVLFDGTRFTIDESYDELVALIEAATAPPSLLSPEAKNALTVLGLTTFLIDYKFTDEPEDYKRGWDSAIDWSLDIINKYFKNKKVNE